MTELITFDPQYLAKKNAHERDQFISFEEGPHIYTVMGERGTYTSVTTIVHNCFPHFDQDAVVDKIIGCKKYGDPTYKYYGMSKNEILEGWAKKGKAASEAGTKMHYDIECWSNGQTDVENTSIEYGYFMNFLHDYPNLEPFRTEWMVYYEELKISGSIDMVYRDRLTGDFYIYDWKRVNEIRYDDSFCDYATETCLQGTPNLNFWHYSLQLGIYKRILETKYGLKIKGMFLICLHPDNSMGNYERIQTANLETEISELFEKRAEMYSDL